MELSEEAVMLILLQDCCCVGYNTTMCISFNETNVPMGCFILVHFGDSFGVVCMMIEKGVLQENEKISQMTMMHATARHGRFGCSEVVNIVK